MQSCRTYNRLLTQAPVRSFSNRPPGGGGGGDQDGYVSDEESGDFDSDRRFSNFVLFAGILSLAGILAASNVMQVKRQKDREASEKA